MSHYVGVGPEGHRAVAGGGVHISLTIGVELEDTDAVEMAIRRRQIADAHLPVEVAAMRSQVDVCCIHYTHRYKLPLRTLPL